jgi:hypothetical protein
MNSFLTSVLSSFYFPRRRVSHHGMIFSLDLGLRFPREGEGVLEKKRDRLVPSSATPDR